MSVCKNLGMNLPLNALRAFEVSARHLSFTRAAEELCVSQAAVSQQVKLLEERLGLVLFRRLPRGLALTDEGLALLPTLSEAFGRIGNALEQFHNGCLREVLNVAVVGTFAVGWLLPRLENFQRNAPFVDLRLFTNNNRVDLAGEGLDFAIRFGDGAWRGTESVALLETLHAPLCAASLAADLRVPGDLARVPLLRSYRADEWPRWFAAAGMGEPVIRGTVFDSSLSMANAAEQGLGVALLPTAMFERELRAGCLVQPFSIGVVTGRYWLTWLKSRRESRAMANFRGWLLAAMGRSEA